MNKSFTYRFGSEKTACDQAAPAPFCSEMATAKWRGFSGFETILHEGFSYAQRKNRLQSSNLEVNFEEDLKLKWQWIEKQAA